MKQTEPQIDSDLPLCSGKEPSFTKSYNLSFRFIFVSFLGLLVTCLLLILWFAPAATYICLAGFIGLLLGALASIGMIDYLIKNRTTALINSDILEDETDVRSLFAPVGLSSIDALLKIHQLHIERFADTLHLISEEAEALIERYEVLTENLAAAIIIRDDAGKITYCSPFTEVLTGHALSEIYSSKTDFFIESAHEEDQEKFRRALSVSALGEAFQFRYRFVHKSGIQMWAEMRTVPISSEDGTFLGTLSITLDITGTMRYQEQVEERNKDLQEFSYMISHDLKAPIFTIKGMIGVLKEDHKASLQGEAGEIISHIEKASERLSSLVAAVLEYSKITGKQGLSEPVPLQNIFKEILADYANQIQGLDSKIEIDSDLPTVIGDQTMIYQIFSNLVGNALKYRDPSRPLKILIKKEPKSSRGLISISINDNGLGIPSDKIEGIFRPFQRAYVGGVEGTGIGLACVKKLVHKLSGSVTVTSQEGVGSTFIVALPFAREMNTSGSKSR